MPRKSKEQMKEMLNTLLENNSQTIKVKDYSSEQVVLINGDILKGNERNRFCRRATSKNWIKFIDDIYLRKDNSIEKKIKSSAASKGGKAVQKKYSQEIKKQLNTGVPWNKGKKTNQIPWNKGLTVADDERLKPFVKLGKNNPMFGKKMSDEDKKYRSDVMKDKIASGKFTPNVHNSQTHWQATFNGKKYRSSWEALFQYFNEDYEFETVRIKYNFNNEYKIYIVDFVNHKTKHLVEIKPKAHRTDAKTLAKEIAAIKWCKENQYIYEIITEDMLTLQKVNDYSCFDQETKKRIERLYETS